MEERLFKTIICETKAELGFHAGKSATFYLKKAIEENGQANLVMATGTAQYDTLEYLINQKDIDWSKVVMFHLDEYIGIGSDHPASFVKFLTDRFLHHIPKLRKTHLIDGLEDINKEINYLNQEIHKYTIDLALIGIGENGHLAFNDPPADYEIQDPYIKVELDRECRMQQVNEGWYEDISKVPSQAISMSIRHIMKAKAIVASVPEQRKAIPVYNTLYKPIDPMYPSTVLRLHPHCEVYLDRASASLI